MTTPSFFFFFAPLMAATASRNSLTWEPIAPTLDRALGYHFYWASELGRQLFNQHLLPLGINTLEANILLLLSEIGPIVQARVGQFLLVDKTTMSHAITRLEFQGFVKREPHPTDRRAVSLCLQPIGHELLREVGNAASLAEEELLGPLTGPEREQLLELIKRVTTQPVPTIRVASKGKAKK